MATLFARPPTTLSRTIPRITPRLPQLRRHIQTLEKSPHVHIFPNTPVPSTYTFTLLSTRPPNPSLALGTSTTNPPQPETFTENPHFLQLLQSVVSEHATQDPDVKTAAAAYASPGGSGLGSGGAHFPQQKHRRGNNMNVKKRAVGGGGGAGQGGAGGASAQGGMGGGGVGGFIHVADQRNPPDWGRIPYTEDILGSLEVDGQGMFVGVKGGYQGSGTYRVCTRDGVCHLSPYLMERVLEALREVERNLPKPS